MIEFRINGMWGHVVPRHPKLIPQKINHPTTIASHQTSHDPGR